MTEEEAKTKWCPMLRKGPLGTARNAPEDVPNTCIGSVCMMWRFEPGTREEWHGYCGLAGTP
jgi:hypothetical protein